MYIKLLFGCVFQYFLPSINDNDSRLLNLFFFFFLVCTTAYDQMLVAVENFIVSIASGAVHRTGNVLPCDVQYSLASSSSASVAPMSLPNPKSAILQINCESSSPLRAAATRSFLISIRARRVLSLETKQPQLSATPLMRSNAPFE